MHFKLRYRMGSFGVVMTLVALLPGSMAAYSQQNQPDRSVKATTPEQIDNLAKRAKEGTEQDVRDLTDALLAQASVLSDVGNAFDLKQRVVSAELKFRQGNHKAIAEKDVAEAINRLATKMSLPPYAHTSKSEVRRLRVRLLTVFPHFIASDAPPKADGTFEAVDEVMSPVQAAFAAAVLIQQKLSNPTFQVTEQEHQASKRARSQSQQPIPEGERTREIRDGIQRSASQASLRDMLTEADEFLTSLGIEPLAKEAK